VARNSVRKKKKLGDFPYPSVVFSTTIALIVIGLLGLIVLHTGKLKTLIKQNIEVYVYLNKFTSENERTKLERTISEKEYISRTSTNKAQIKFISKAEAAKEFIAETGEDFLNFVDDNPLFDSYVVNIKESFYTPQQMKEIKTELESFPEVMEVQYQADLVDAINSNLQKISLVLAGIGILLMVIVVVLINNTIRLAMFSQRFLIRSMQLVGAKTSFIRTPFIRRSVLYALLSGIIAGILLFGLLQFVHQSIPELSALYDLVDTILLFIFVAVFGIILVVFGTLSAVNRYLNMSLDELY